MRKFKLWTGLFVLISGCASEHSKSSVVPNKKADLVCNYEKEIGSNMKKKVCRTPEQMALQRETAKEAMTRMQTGSEVKGQ